jgi:hypothetical protein
VWCDPGTWYMNAMVKLEFADGHIETGRTFGPVIVARRTR